MKKSTLKIIKDIEISIFGFYKKYISPALKQMFGGGCRYNPTCSDYAVSAIEKYGPFKGLFLSIVRFFSCNPFSKHPREYPLV